MHSFAFFPSLPLRIHRPVTYGVHWRVKLGVLFFSFLSFFLEKKEKRKRKPFVCYAGLIGVKSNTYFFWSVYECFFFFPSGDDIVLCQI